MVCSASLRPAFEPHETEKSRSEARSAALKFIPLYVNSLKSILQK
jgi:hypothetical protein